MIRYIEDAIAKYQESAGCKPTWIKVSPKVHDMLVEELNKRDGKPAKAKRIFELFGIRLDIDCECPPGGAYIGRDEA